MKNCATCKFMNFRCKGNCGDCVNKVEELPPHPSADADTFPSRGRLGVFFSKEEVEEKCKCTECYDEDSGKYKYWVGEPELMKYFGNAECGVRSSITHREVSAKHFGER